MQLTPRYLLKQRINLQSSETGYTVEYRPVYARQIKVYRGIENQLYFRLLNADQKPVAVTATPVFVAFDENRNQVLEYEATVTDDGSSRDSRGTFEVTIPERDLVNIRQQYLHYNIYLQNHMDHRTLTYAGRNFDSTGVIFIDGLSFPGPKRSTEIVNFYPVNNQWIAGNTAADSVYAFPGTNGQDALHTVAVYSVGYSGLLTIQATLENQISGQNNWFDITQITFSGTENQPVSVNFNGVYSYLRFVFDNDPAGLITKILIRN
jgi:hypothetical protein